MKVMCIIISVQHAKQCCVKGRQEIYWKLCQQPARKQSQEHGTKQICENSRNGKKLSETYVMKLLTLKIRTQEDLSQEKWEKWTVHTMTG